MSLLKTSTSRIAITMVCILAWFGASNHCALAAIEDLMKSNEGAAEFCTHCASEGKGKTVPANSGGCCKGLKVTSQPSKPVRFGNELMTLIVFAAVISSDTPYTPLSVLGTVAGPPGHSFAETVLHRSLQSHAPPFIG